MIKVEDIISGKEMVSPVRLDRTLERAIAFDILVYFNVGDRITLLSEEEYRRVFLFIHHMMTKDTGINLLRMLIQQGFYMPQDCTQLLKQWIMI